MWQHYTTLPKKQQQCNQLQSGPLKPNEKGKGHSDNQDPQSPVTSGSQPKGKAPGAPAYTPSEWKEIPMLPKKRLTLKSDMHKKRPRRHMSYHTQTYSLVTSRKMLPSITLNSCLGCWPGKVRTTWPSHQASAPALDCHCHHAV
jgi:hypothetical protein